MKWLVEKRLSKGGVIFVWADNICYGTIRMWSKASQCNGVKLCSYYFFVFVILKKYSNSHDCRVIVIMKLRNSNRTASLSECFYPQFRRLHSLCSQFTNTNPPDVQLSWRKVHVRLLYKTGCIFCECPVHQSKVQCLNWSLSKHMCSDWPNRLDVLVADGQSVS